MPIRLDGSTSDYVGLSTTNYPTVTSYTITFWMQVVTANAGVNRQFYTCALSPSEQRIWRNSSNLDGYVRNQTTGTNLSANTNETDWYMWALTANGTAAGDGKVYAWKLGDADGTYESLSFQPDSYTPNDILLGGTYYATGRNARFCFVKLWDAALSLSELQAERAYGKPVRTTSVNRYHRLATSTDTSDGSGNGRTCSVNGAVTEGSEPVPWAPVPAQSRFRWRKDDGSETAATWASSENNNVVAPLG